MTCTLVNYSESRTAQFDDREEAETLKALFEEQGDDVEIVPDDGDSDDDGSESTPDADAAKPEVAN